MSDGFYVGRKHVSDIFDRQQPYLELPTILSSQAYLF